MDLLALGNALADPNTRFPADMDIKQTLKAQQDFIELFPDDWSFDIEGGRLKAVVKNDKPVTAEEDDIELPDQSVTSAVRARADVEAKLKQQGIDVKLVGGRVTRGYLDGVTLRFPSYAMAFEYYVHEYAWNEYDSSFQAIDILAQIQELEDSGNGWTVHV